MRITDFLMVILSIILIFFLGAVGHERDMSRNFKETGCAKAWFYEIKCDCSSEEK